MRHTHHLNSFVSLIADLVTEILLSQGLNKAKGHILCFFSFQARGTNASETGRAKRARAKRGVGEGNTEEKAGPGAAEGSPKAAG